jgi:hypothetical protein
MGGKMEFYVKFRGRQLTVQTSPREWAEEVGTLSEGQRTFRCGGTKRYGHPWWRFGIAVGQSVTQFEWEGYNRNWLTLREAEEEAEAAEDEADPDAWERRIQAQVDEVRRIARAIKEAGRSTVGTMAAE